MVFPSDDQIWSADASMTLRDTPEVCTALREAHERYCKEVEDILFPGRRQQEADAKIANDHGFCA
jgi:hypothetical protein